MCAMERYSAKNEGEVVPFAATRMQLDIITLTEGRQRETDRLCMASFILSLLSG